MARILAEELAAGRRDLRALAHRWMAHAQSHPAGIDRETGDALAHLARHDSPPSHAAGEGSDPLVRTVPVALAAFDAPRALVSATYHIAALTHPDPIVAWSAVAVNVAIARFLQGKRDFVADVIEVLRRKRRARAAARGGATRSDSRARRSDPAGPARPGARTTPRQRSGWPTTSRCSSGA